MKTIIGTLAAGLMLAQPLPAYAGSEPVMQPVQVGAETVRYHQGVPTLDLALPHGGVQITPLPMDHGSLSFGIAVLNAGDAPANVDVTNFAVTADTQALPVFTKDQLVSKAKNRAMWAAIAVGLAGGLASAAAASQRDYYHSTFITPRGTYHAFASAPSAAGQIEAAALAAGTGVALGSIATRLDATRAALGEQIVQMTTLDPGDSYAGRIVVAKLRNPKMPLRVSIVVHWNGDDYPFAFQLAKAGTPAPVFTALTARPIPPVPPAGPAPTSPASAAPAAATPTPLPTAPKPPAAAAPVS